MEFEQPPNTPFWSLPGFNTQNYTMYNGKTYYSYLTKQEHNFYFIQSQQINNHFHITSSYIIVLHKFKGRGQNPKPVENHKG